MGVVGLGGVAQAVHLPLLDGLSDRFRIEAVADLSASLRDTIGDRYRVAPGRRFGSAEELLAARGLDAVLVLTTGSHAAIARAVVEAGLPVFVEKPLAYALAETDGLAEAMRAVGGRLELGYMKLWDPAVVRVRDLLADRRAAGRPGVRSIEVVVLHPPSAPQLAHARLLDPPTDVPSAVLTALAADTEALRREALGDDVPDVVRRLYTSVLLGSVVHDLALIRDFAGDPVAIDHADAWTDGPWPPSVAIDGRLEGGGRLSIRWHYLTGYPVYRELLRLVFDDATIELEFPSPYLLHAPTALRVVELDGTARRDTSFGSYAEAFEEELLAFHRLVTDGAPPLASVAQGRADIVTCQRIAARLAEAAGGSVGGEAAVTAATDAARTDAARSEARAGGTAGEGVVSLPVQSSWTTRPS